MARWHQSQVLLAPRAHIPKACKADERLVPSWLREAGQSWAGGARSCAAAAAMGGLRRLRAAKRRREPWLCQ